MESFNPSAVSERSVIGKPSRFSMVITNEVLPVASVRYDE